MELLAPRRVSSEGRSWLLNESSKRTRNSEINLILYEIIVTLSLLRLRSEW